MNHNNKKFVANNTTQQNTRSSQTSRTTSITRTTSTRFVSRSSSFATNVVAISSTYNPVYNQTRGSQAFGTINQIVPDQPLHNTPSSVPTRLTVPTLTGNNSITQDARRLLANSTSAAPGPSNHTFSERYDLKDKAYVLIFHHTFKNDPELHRKGTEHDIKLIKDVFKNYRAEVPSPCEDYTVQKVEKKMTEIRKKSFNNYSCLIVIIMSHGERRDLIRAKDKTYDFEAKIVEPILMNDSLKNKPKLFFVQACKGGATMETDFHPKATNKFDMLKCYSTYEGTVSMRDTEKGSFFIQNLFQIIEKNADKEIIDIMTLIRNECRSTRVQQAPTETSTLTKKFYFSDLKKK
ncbi:caspase-7-like [Ochlerotatus camptorhynchus]|uniref:caspase-7-like n=1 Tax=Ochlerotatus camptorhynchus TaxID=644619 RepID=UPI0031D3D577